MKYQSFSERFIWMNHVKITNLLTLDALSFTLAVSDFIPWLDSVKILWKAVMDLL